MIRLPAAAATLLAFAIVSSPGARAGCDEDCYYEAQEAAYERAYDRASAREEAAEEGYYQPEGRSPSRSSRRSSKLDRAVAKRTAPARNVAEPKPNTPTQSQPSPPRTKVAGENSSIAGGSGDVAVDDHEVRWPAKAVGCKSYFPSVGMTLSVPCD